MTGVTKMTRGAIDATRRVLGAAVIFFGCMAPSACSAPDAPPPGQAEVLAFARSVTVALQPCDGGYRAYRKAPGGKAAQTASKLCSDALVTIGNIPVPNKTLNDAQHDAVNRAWRQCAISAGARDAWFAGIANTELKIEDGEANASNQALLCINDLMAAADAVQISTDDKRLLLPANIP